MGKEAAQILPVNKVAVTCTDEVLHVAFQQLLLKD